MHAHLHHCAFVIATLLLSVAPCIHCVAPSQAHDGSHRGTLACSSHHTILTSFDDLQDCEDPMYYQNLNMYGRDNFGAVFIRARCPRLSTDTPPGVLVMYPGVLVSAHIAHMNKVVSGKGANVSFVEFTHAGSKSKCPKDPLNTNSNVDRISVSPALLSDMKIASPGLPKGTLLSPPRMCDGDQTFFEHWSVLTAVQEARHSFVMAELGAGWGRFAAISAAAARMRNLPFQLIMVEANDVHYQFLLNTMSLNNIPPSQFLAVHGAVTTDDTTVTFRRSNPDMQYGARVIDMSSNGNSRFGFSVLGYSLETLFSPYFFIDFVHFDIEGSEHGVIPQSAHVLTTRVKRIYVECHGAQIFENLLFFIEDSMQWEIEYEISPGSQYTDPNHGHIGAVNPFIN
jgi:FkbM family methyltransferase